MRSFGARDRPVAHLDHVDPVGTERLRREDVVRARRSASAVRHPAGHAAGERRDYGCGTGARSACCG
jgi:hypothetical protein